MEGRGLKIPLGFVGSSGPKTHTPRRDLLSAIIDHKILRKQLTGGKANYGTKSKRVIAEPCNFLALGDRSQIPNGPHVRSPKDPKVRIVPEMH